MIPRLLMTVLATLISALPLIALAAPAPVPKTGQTIGYQPNDDGALQTGVAWPVPRFVDNGNGTVTDRLTGLTWLKNASCTDTVGGIAKTALVLSWSNAIRWSNGLASGACGLSDGSAAGEWRLPNVEQLSSLMDYSRHSPALNAGHPFFLVQPDYYWSSTTSVSGLVAAWRVHADGMINSSGKINGHHVWPVRAAQPAPYGALELSPTSNDFGNVTTATASTPQTFTLGNTGKIDLKVSAITLTGGNSGQFSLALGSCGTRPTIAVGGSCTISAAFAPTSAGDKKTTLRISSNDLLTPAADIALSGSGVLPSYTIGTSVVGGSGSVICDSPVIQGGSSVCAVTPDQGYQPETFSDNGVDKLLFVNNNSYTIKNVTADHAISATFASSTTSSSHIVINNGAATTKNPSVTLTLTCNGAASMQFLVDKAAAWTPLMPFAGSKRIMLPAGNGSKTVAVRFLDTNGNTTAIYSASIFLDTAPPVGSITINSGAATTPSKDLSLTLSASDSYGGTLQMRLSEDGISWNNSSWVPYAASPTYTLGTLPVKTTITPGLKRVYVQFRDESGKISRLYSDTINYLGPTVVTTPSNIAINGSATHTVSAAVSLTLTAPAGEAFVRLSNNGITYGAWLPMTTSPLTRGWTLPAGDGVKTVYAQYITDKSTPATTTYSATIILDTVAPAGWLLINNGAAVTSGTTVNLTMGATDVNGVASMCIKEATPICGPADFVAYGESLSSYPITPTDGVKKIYITFKDNAGKVSTPVSASVILDSTQLAGTVLINGGSPTTTSAAVTLKITATKAVHMQISVDNGLTWSDWEPYVVTKKVTLPAGAGERIVVVRFRDFAGNQSPNSSDSITLAP